jgi:predicted small integral membrane protein
MLMLRLCKTALVASIAFFFTLVAFGNITDYVSNWQFVQHVLSMDTTFADSSLHWRAISNQTIQTAGYWLIIATEAVTAILLWAGAAGMFACVRSSRFGQAKTMAVVGLSLGLLLYLVGFIAVGGEWFAMWQSQIWNGEQKAFDFVAMIGLVLVVVLLPEANPPAARA